MPKFVKDKTKHVNMITMHKYVLLTVNMTSRPQCGNMEIFTLDKDFR